jgi:hypothetical protein
LRVSDGGTLQTRVEYAYDALGRRIFDKSNQYDSGGTLTSSVTTRHIFDGNQVDADTGVRPPLSPLAKHIKDCAGILRRVC